MARLDHDDVLALADELGKRQADRLLRESEVAAMLAIGKSTVRHYVSKNLIPPPLKFGCTAVWRLSVIQQVIEGLEAA